MGEEIKKKVNGRSFYKGENITGFTVRELDLMATKR